ncbi:MAG: hypothetical protein V4635_18360 [Bacteroidota bacterium]
MKKVLFIAAIASLSLASCKKDYTCECSTSFFGTTFLVKTAAKSSKKGAEEWCKGLQTSTSTVDGQPSPSLPMTCAIK